MNVLSLLPASTEIVCALGAGESLVGISHECDWPVSIAGLPRVTRSALEGADVGAAETDAAVRARSENGEALFELDEAVIATLRPDVILTQRLCAVCAVSETEVRALARRLSPAPRVVTLGGGTLDGVFEDIRTVAAALGRAAEGEALLAALRDRMGDIHERLRAERAPRPRLAVIEWTDPPFVAGHWVPELVRRAGGVDVLAQPGEHSRTVTPDEVRRAAPELLVVAPCGHSLERAAETAREMLGGEAWRWGRDLPVWAMDANALLSRGGPRLVEGLSVLACIMHPSLFGAPRSGAALVHPARPGADRLTTSYSR